METGDLTGILDACCCLRPSPVLVVSMDGGRFGIFEEEEKGAGLALLLFPTLVLLLLLDAVIFVSNAANCSSMAASGASSSSLSLSSDNTGVDGLCRVGLVGAGIGETRDLRGRVDAGVSSSSSCNQSKSESESAIS